MVCEARALGDVMARIYTIPKISDTADAGIPRGKSQGVALSGVSRSAKATDVRSLRARVRSMLVLLDIAAIIAGITFASWLRADHTLSQQAPQLIALLTVLYLGLALSNHAYDAASMTNLSRAIRGGLLSLAVAAMLAMGIGFALKVSQDYSRFAIVAGLLTSGILIVVVRIILNRRVRTAAPHGLIRRIRLYQGASGLPVAGEETINIDVHSLEPRLDCPQTLDKIGRLLAEADEVIVSCDADQRELWSTALKGLGIRVEMEIPEMAALRVIGEEDRHREAPTVLVGRGPLNTDDQIVKRCFDLGVVLFLLPMLIPITLIVAILIKLEDGGPILFIQNRIGQGNRLFALYKFRSMSVASQDKDGIISASRNDARVTRIGRFLRSTSIDELPQLYNVLLGNMSIVGPRPHAVASRAGDRLFWDVDHRYWWRHAAKPGLTGLAQIRGFRGATDTADDLRGRVQLDLEYLEGWTLWRDFAISAATLKVILHPNAY